MPELDLGQRELGVVGCDDEVGRERELEAATHRQAVDGGDDGLADVEELGEAREAAGAVLGVNGLAIGRGLEVPSGAEEALACPGENRSAQRRVVAQLGERPRRGPCSWRR